MLFTLTMILALSTPLVWGDALIANHSFTGHWQEIPTSVINDIVNNNDIYYVHTSHGSQILTGFTPLNELDSNFYDLNDSPYQIFNETSDDLGYYGDTSWAAPTRTYLNANPGCNMVMYFWCGGVSYTSEAGINIYLNKMTELEAQYPNVTFIYMTGHLDGTGITGNLYLRNNQIRQYCIDNEKVLFDFADIESYDPDGNYYPDETDSCGWCHEWCNDSENDCADDCSCAHSHCFNCLLKAQTWWVMMAYLEGWSLTDIQEDETALPSNFRLAQNYPNPFNPVTSIEYYLPFDTQVKIEIFTIDGRYVETLIDETQTAGSYIAKWNGEKCSSGVYFAYLKTPSTTAKIKMTLLK